MCKYYLAQGKFADAEVLLKQCLDMMMSALGETHEYTKNTMLNLAKSYQSQGKYADAEILLEQCMDTTISLLGATHDDTVRAMNNN